MCACINCKTNLLKYIRVFFQDYMSEMLKAMTAYGCKVIGYVAWSLMDNFEWMHGYG